MPLQASIRGQMSQLPGARHRPHRGGYRDQPTGQLAQRSNRPARRRRAFLDDTLRDDVCRGLSAVAKTHGRSDRDVGPQTGIGPSVAYVAVGSPQWRGCSRRVRGNIQRSPRACIVECAFCHQQLATVQENLEKFAKNYAGELPFHCTCEPCVPHRQASSCQTFSP